MDTHIHICGCVWVEDDEGPDAVDGEGRGWTKVSGCEDHPNVPSKED